MTEVIAVLKAPALWLPMMAVLTACLVTDQVRFSEPNVPAHLVRTSPAFGFTRVNAKSSGTCGDAGGWVSVQARLSDPNVGDALRMRVVVNGRAIHQETLSASDSVERAPVDYCLPASFLEQRRCNKVELLVSREFDFDRNDDPYATTDGDLARLEWWILADATDEPLASDLDCLDIEGDAGL